MYTYSHKALIFRWCIGTKNSMDDDTNTNLEASQGPLVLSSPENGAVALQHDVQGVHLGPLHCIVAVNLPK